MGYSGYSRPWGTLGTPLVHSVRPHRPTAPVCNGTAARESPPRIGPGRALMRASDGEVQMLLDVAPHFGEAAGGQAGAVLEGVPAPRPAGLQCRASQMPCAPHRRCAWRALFHSVQRTRRGRALARLPRGPSGVGHQPRRLRQNHDRQPRVRVHLREPAAERTGVRTTSHRCDVCVARRRCAALAETRGVTSCGVFCAEHEARGVREAYASSQSEAWT